jgi:hypothetical protein
MYKIKNKDIDNTSIIASKIYDAIKSHPNNLKLGFTLEVIDLFPGKMLSIEYLGGKMFSVEYIQEKDIQWHDEENMYGKLYHINFKDGIIIILDKLPDEIKVK